MADFNDSSSSSVSNVNNNSTSTDMYCAVAKGVLGARGFAYLLVLEILLGISAVLVNSILMVMVWRVSVFHYNLRLLLSQLSLALLWYSGGYVIKSIVLLDRIVSGSDPCRMTMAAYECKIQEMPYTIPIALTPFTLLAINVERLYSTVLYRRYELGDGAVPWLGALLALTAWVGAMSTVFGQAVGIPRDRMVGICENLLSMNPAGAGKAFATSVVALLAAVVICLIGYLWNKYRLKQAAINRAQHTLASRFQIDQNVKVNKVMMPSMLIVTFSYLPNYAFLTVVISGLQLSYEVQTWLIHVNYLWKLFYALAHAVLSFKRNTYLRRRIGKVGPTIWTGASSSSQQAGRKPAAAIRQDVINEHQIHFTILEEAWRVSARAAGIDGQSRMKRGVTSSKTPSGVALLTPRRDLNASTTTRF